MTIKSFVTLAAIAAVGVFSTGCSDPCGDIKDCCIATYEAAMIEDTSACDLYDEADSDACQAAIDAYEVPEGVDVPAECDL